MDNSDIFIKVLLHEKVKLEPKYIHNNYRGEILKRLQQKLENICSKHGFIKQNSIEVYKVCPGLVELVSLNGYIQYDVQFYALVCNPVIGSVVNCKVTNSNRFGILAEAGSILEIIIAKNSVSIVSDVNLDEIKIGDNVKVEIMGKKYELKDKKISIVGRVIKDNEASNKKKSITNNVTQEEDEDSNEEDALPTEDEDDISSSSDDEDEDLGTDDDESVDVDQIEDHTDTESEDESASIKKKSGGENFFSDDDDGGLYEDEGSIEINDEREDEDESDYE